MVTLAYILGRLLVKADNAAMAKIDDIVKSRIMEAQDLSAIVNKVQRGSFEYNRLLPELKDKGRQALEGILGVLRSYDIDAKTVAGDLAQKYTNDLSAVNPNDTGAIFVLQYLSDWFNK